MDPLTINPAEIDRLLGRRRRPDQAPDQVLVDVFFEQILRSADRFVPSEAGWVLIDDPDIKVSSWAPTENELVFVAGFGEGADQVVGQRIKGDEGVAGRTYLTGQPCILQDATGEDERLGSILGNIVTNSLLSVPIQIGRSTCGVLELVNRRDGDGFEDRDMELLLIFAGYISTSLQNVLDANRYRELAKIDDLTGLYNDRYFNQALSESLEAAESDGSDLSLIFLDLDRFKEVNDEHGHLVGSQTLREVGLILRGATTPERAIVARYGGDEFVIIIPDCSLEEGIEVAEAVRAEIEETDYFIDQGVDGEIAHIHDVLTASVGVASYLEFGFTDEGMTKRKNALIRRADQSMYRAKESGKNRVCWFEEACAEVPG